MEQPGDSDIDRNPESAAVTGGVPAAAEPSPTTRGRASAAAGAPLLYIVLGVVLILVALIADQESSDSLGTAIAGIALIAIAVLALTRVLGPVTIAILGFIAGVLLTVVAFSASDFDWPQWFLLVAGAAAFIASFASLAAAKRPALGDEEPGAGVENV